MNHATDRPLRQPWWRRRLWWQSGVAAGAASLGVATFIVFLGSPTHSVLVSLANLTIATVEHGTFHDFIPLRAKVVALNTVYLSGLNVGERAIISDYTGLEHIDRIDLTHNRSREMLKLKSISKIYRTTEVRVVAETLLAA